MKKFLLIALALFIFNLSFGQISRVIQSQITTTAFGSDGIMEGDNLYQYSIMSNSFPGDTSRLENVVYDKLGNVLEINNYDLLQFNSITSKVIGVYKKNNDIHLIHVQKRMQTSTPNSEQTIIEFNINTNTIVQTTDLNLGNLFNHSGNSVLVNNTIVTYAVQVNVGLIRAAVSVTDLSNITTEVVDPQITTNGPSAVATIGVAVEGFFEYISVSSTHKVYKRTSPNQYISTQFLPPTWFQNASSSVAATSTKVVLTYANRYCVMDTNLDSLSTGLVTIAFSNNGSVQIVTKNNQFYVLEHILGSRIHSFDANFSPISVLDLGAKFRDGFFKLSNGKLVFCSSLFAGSGFLDRTIAFVSENTSTAIPFQDLGVYISADNTEMRTIDAFQVVANQHLGAFSVTESGLYNTDSITARPFIYAAGNNLVAKNNNSVVGSYGTFNNSNLYNFGPFTNVASYNSKIRSIYSRGNFVSKKLIQDHIDSLNFGSSSYIPGHGIREWPAHGDVSIGQAANVAPFVDVNNNGNYEPMLGDYPKIFGDECYLAIGHLPSNQVGSAEIELHSYRFTFSCDTGSVIKKTIFQRNHFIPRGMALDSVYVGVNVDFDIGSATDDYAGTNVELGMIYGYNGGLNDLGPGGFGTQIPAYGVITLEGAKQEDDGQDNAIGAGPNESINGLGYNDGILDNERLGLISSVAYSNGSSFPNVDPNTLVHQFNHAQGIYSTGIPQVLNSGGVPYKHSYYGTSDPLFYSSQGVDHGNSNSELTSSNASGDRRMSGYSGPTSAQIDDTISTLIAFLYGVDSVNISPDNSVANLFQDAALLKSYYTANNAGCGISFGTIQEDLDIQENEINNIVLYPNPTKDKFTLDGMEGNTKVILMDMNGSVLKTINSDQTNLEMDLSDFTNGMYFVRLQTEKGSALFKVSKN